MDVQHTLESNVEKRTKDSFGPLPGKRLLVFIDDINMPNKKLGLAGQTRRQQENSWRQHLSIHQLLTLIAGYNLSHTCGGG